MYTILMNSEKDLITTVREVIYEKEKDTTTLRFLIPVVLGDYDLRKSTIVMEYSTPDRKNRYEVLKPESELYNNFIDCRVKIGTKITALPGNVDIHLSFVTLNRENEGYNEEALHSGNTVIEILPLKQLYGFNCDESMELIDQLICKTNAQIEALNKISNTLNSDKADDIERVGDEIWVYSNKEPIGDPVTIREPKWEEI